MTIFHPLTDPYIYIYIYIYTHIHVYNIYIYISGNIYFPEMYLLFSTAMLPPSPSLSSDTVLLCSQHLSSAVEGFSSSVLLFPFLLLAGALCLWQRSFSLSSKRSCFIYCFVWSRSHGFLPLKHYSVLYLQYSLSAINDKMPMCISLHFDGKTQE